PFEPLAGAPQQFGLVVAADVDVPVDRPTALGVSKPDRPDAAARGRRAGGQAPPLGEPVVMGQELRTDGLPPAFEGRVEGHGLSHRGGPRWRPARAHSAGRRGGYWPCRSPGPRGPGPAPWWIVSYPWSPSE